MDMDILMGGVDMDISISGAHVTSIILRPPPYILYRLLPRMDLYGFVKAIQKDPPLRCKEHRPSDLWVAKPLGSDVPNAVPGVSHQNHANVSQMMFLSSLRTTRKGIRKGPAYLSYQAHPLVSHVIHFRLHSVA